MNPLAILAVLTLRLSAGDAPDSASPFAIHVVDEATGRGVPLVELRTTSNVLHVTDSNGIAAVRSPELMGQKVFFYVRSHGYEFAKDGCGYRGRALDVTPGSRVQLKLRRINIAERLYRVTGTGIYRDSVLVGEPVPIRQPLLNSRVTGSDSVLSAIHQGRIHWFWGNTFGLRYPLGTFHAPGATSDLPGRGGLDPAVGVDLHYFPGKGGFTAPTAKVGGPGPTWLSGLVVLGESERERMFAHHVKIDGDPDGDYRVRERGLLEFDDDTMRFRHVATYPHAEPFPDGSHPFFHQSDGRLWIYYCDPFALIRVPAEPEALHDQARYEAFTPLRQGERDPLGELDRDDDDTLRYTWKRDTAPVRPMDQERLVRAGRLRSDEIRLTLQDVDTGKRVIAHRGTVAWNRYRQRWVMILVETRGSSLVGEIWYAEADRPGGPWVWARKIMTHDSYSFYNPRHHAFFDSDDGQLLYFEGTYSTTLSGNTNKTPLYDYNQIMYRLDLRDERLRLPVAVYEDPSRGASSSLVVGPAAATADLAVAFWALDRAAAGTVPVFAVHDDTEAVTLRIGPVVGVRTPPLFHAYPPDLADPPTTTVPLREFVSAAGKQRIYSTSNSDILRGFRRGETPLVLVWPHAGARSNFGKLLDGTAAWAELSPSTGKARRGGSSVFFLLEHWPAEGAITFPRLNNPVKSVSLAGARSAPGLRPRLRQTPTRWTIELPGEAPAPSPHVVILDLIGAPYLPTTPRVIAPNRDGVIELRAHDAVVHSKKLCYEPQPHKNTLGYWVNPEDRARWHVAIPRAAEYELHVLQGCGTGQGGSTVRISLGNENSGLTFTVEDTGHFQNFRWRHLGRLRADSPGQSTLDVVPQKLAHKAVMDLRAVRLVPVAR